MANVYLDGNRNCQREWNRCRNRVLDRIRLYPDRLLVLVKGDLTWADFGMTAPTSNFFVVNDDVHV